MLVDRTVTQWMEAFNEAGVPAGRIRTMDQVYDWEQLDHLGLVDRVEHPTAGELALPGAPVAWSRSGRRPASPPPRLGEHQAEVFDEG